MRRWGVRDRITNTIRDVWGEVETIIIIKANGTIDQKEKKKGKKQVEIPENPTQFIKRNESILCPLVQSIERPALQG